MVLVWLDKIEVSAHALRETIVTVKLEFGREDRVETAVLVYPLYGVSGGYTSRAWVVTVGLLLSGLDGKDDITAIWVRWVTAEWTEVFGVSVIEPLLSTTGRVKENTVLLDNPDKFLTWVVEVEFNLIAG